MSRRDIALISISAALIASVIYLAHVRSKDRIIEKTRPCMGTVVQIMVPITGADDARRALSAVDDAFGRIDRVESLFSVFKTNSEISGINRLKALETLRIDDEVFDLIEKSVEYNRRTYGAFDISVKPLVDLWAKARAAGVEPRKEEIAAALGKVGSDKIVLDRAARTIKFKKTGMALDMGGVAKGYAADMAVKTLKNRGVENAVVNCGGDMYCLGSRDGNIPWKIGVRHPRDKTRVMLTIDAKDTALDTSGDYEKYFTANGRRYSHIIDPRTGYPVGDGTVSATVIAKDAATADILATALCVLGKDGLDLIRLMGGADALLVINENGKLKIYMTEGFGDRHGIGEGAKL